MKEKILIVEDQFVEADYLRLMLTQAGYIVTGIARSVPQAIDLMNEQKPDFVLLDIFLKGRQTGIDLAKQLTAEHIPFVYLSANSTEDILNEAKATEPYGFLVKPFKEKDLLVTLEIARYRHKHSLESRYQQEAGLKKDIKRIMAESKDYRQTLLKIATVLQKHIPFDFMAAGFDNIGQPSFSGICFLRIGFNEYQQIGLNELMTITNKTLQELIALQSGSPKESIATVYNNQEFKNICRHPSLRKLFADTFHLKSHLEMPMFIMNGKPFSFCLYSKISDAYNATHLGLFENLQMLLINSIETTLHHAANYEKPQQETVSSNKSEYTDLRNGCEDIIGKSPLLLNVLDQVAQVASSDTSVLLLGESGTGKEKIAECIHNLSNRKNKPFIKVNCGALPATLIESELFGHEKGAFTGALEKRIGKFEKANLGTILLDEIGEMPLELQVKLLRVLQGKEIERIGGTDTIKIDVRIIAATNKNLEKEVAEGRFRLDLYYRLNVFPIELPPLRERKEDIPALAYHFMNYYNNKAGKKINGIADNVLKTMMAYSWRGNIRELQHLIERSVLLTKGNTIEEISLPLKKALENTHEKSYTKTIQENERDYIISVLKKCNGRIWGAGGAAEVLNLPPSTLKSKMKKLGIKKEFIG